MKKIQTLLISLCLLSTVGIVSADWNSEPFGGSVTIGEYQGPEQSNPSPSNSSINQSLNPQLSIYVCSRDSGDYNTRWYTNESGSWVLMETDMGVPHNSTATCTPTNFSNYSTTYYWRVASEGTGEPDDEANNTYHFTTRAAPATTYNWSTTTFGGSVEVQDSQPLSITNEDPQNTNTSVELTPTLSAYFSIDSGTMNVYFRTNASGSWITIYSLTGAGNATRSTTNTANMNSYLTKYWWQACAQDTSTNLWYNETYSFITLSDTNISYYYISPTNGSTNISRQPTLQVNPKSSNPERGNVDLYFRSNASGSWSTLCYYENVAENVTRSCTSTSSMNAYNTTYYWSANASLVGETEWTNTTFHFTTQTYEDSVNITYHSATFGGSVNVYEPGVTLVSRSFGGSVEVYEYNWSNWSNWWTIEQQASTITISDFLKSHNKRHCVDWINISVDCENATYVFLNITGADYSTLSINITQNNTRDTYWCNRTFDNGASPGALPYGWPAYGNGTYNITIYATSAVANQESSQITFIIYPNADVTMNNITNSMDLSQILGSNWGSSGANRFHIEDTTGNGIINSMDLSYVLASANWGWEGDV